MAISKTQCGWMALGGCLCLFGLALVCKLRDGNKVEAQADSTTTMVPVVPLVGVAGSDAKPAVTQAAPADGATEEHKGKPLVGVGPTTLDSKDAGKAEHKGKPPSSDDLAPLVSPNEPLPPLGTILPTEKKSPLPIPTPVAPSTTVPTTTPPDAPPTVTGSAPLPVIPTTPMVPAASPAAPVMRTEFRTDQQVEPPLASHNGPLQAYHVKHEGETPRDIARRTLGSAERCDDIVRLNPNLKADTHLTEGALVKLPADACLPGEDVESITPLPTLRKPTQTKVRALPLTGTFPCNLDDKHTITLPRAIRDQLGQGETVLVSPGADQCLWLTNQAHLDRLAERLEQSNAKEIDVRVFKRLYYAQTEKVAVSGDGRVQISDRLAQFAGLHQEVVLVGIDDHFELWDIGRWKEYTLQKSAAARAAMGEE